jgi:F-type H+-transporting ATPase subunit delta
MTAHPLTADQLGALEQKLRAREGRTVKVRTSVDPELLGGIVVTIGSQRLDNSIRTRLNTLAQAMKG